MKIIQDRNKMKDYLDIVNNNDSESQAYKTAYKYLTDLLKSKEDSFIGNLNFYFLANINTTELVCFFNICCGGTILLSLYAILTIKFGDYLIKRYDLENKHPYLIKIVLIRRKLSKYTVLIYII